MISVVMPVYNVARFLREAVESILNQTYGDFELIVLEGGSTDGSAEIIHSYNDPRVRIELEPAAGAASMHQWFVRSLNKGISLASRPLIARMDADDVSLPRRFERQMHVFAQHPDLALLGTGLEYLTENGAISHRSHSNALRWSSRVGDVMHVPGIAHGSAMFPRDTARAVGGYREQFVKAEDRDMWYRLAACGKAAVLDERLFLYRINTMSLIGAYPQRGDLYARLAAEFSIERLRTGKDPLMRGEPLPAIPSGAGRFMKWQALTRNSLVATVEGQRVRAVWMAGKAALLRPLALGTWRAVFTAARGG